MFVGLSCDTKGVNQSVTNEERSNSVRVFISLFVVNYVPKYVCARSELSVGRLQHFACIDYATIDELHNYKTFTNVLYIWNCKQDWIERSGM